MFIHVYDSRSYDVGNFDIQECTYDAFRSLKCTNLLEHVCFVATLT